MTLGYGIIPPFVARTQRVPHVWPLAGFVPVDSAGLSPETFSPQTCASQVPLRGNAALEASAADPLDLGLIPGDMSAKFIRVLTLRILLFKKGLDPLLKNFYQ